MPEPTRYRKRPVVVEAMQTAAALDLRDQAAGEAAAVAAQDHNAAVARWIVDRGGEVEDYGINYLEIPTLEGDMTAYAGDWIVCGVHGEFYPVKPDIFAATYEPAEDQ